MYIDRSCQKQLQQEKFQDSPCLQKFPFYVMISVAGVFSFSFFLSFYFWIVIMCYVSIYLMNIMFVVLVTFSFFSFVLIVVPIKWERYHSTSEQFSLIFLWWNDSIPSLIELDLVHLVNSHQLFIIWLRKLYRRELTALHHGVEFKLL